MECLWRPVLGKSHLLGSVMLMPFHQRMPVRHELGKDPVKTISTFVLTPRLLRCLVFSPVFFLSLIV